MTLELRLRPEAEQDLLEAAGWYEAQQRTLGHQFLDEALVVFAAISEAPRMYPEVHREVRRAVLRRFPFGVFYKIEDTTVTVVAVMHASRDPERWKSRT